MAHTEEAREGQSKNQDTPEDYLSVQAESYGCQEDIVALHQVVIEVHGILNPDHEYDLDEVDKATKDVVLSHLILRYKQCLITNFPGHPFLKSRKEETRAQLLNEEGLVSPMEFILIIQEINIEGDH